MPAPVVIAIFVGIGLVGSLAIIFWEKIIGWAHDAVFPWFKKHMPAYEKWVREAFVVMNKVAATVRKLAIEAWRRIRPKLLDQVVEWRRTSDNHYVCKVLSWIAENMKERKVDQVISTQTVDPDDLPLEIQEIFLRGATHHKWEVAKEQDRQVELAEKELSLEH